MNGPFQMGGAGPEQVAGREPNEALGLIEALGRAVVSEALAEVRESLLDLAQVPRELFRVDFEVVAGAAPKCRASLKLTDAGRNLALALGARDLDLLVVKDALGHFNLSVGGDLGDDAESGADAKSAPDGAPQ